MRRHFARIDNNGIVIGTQSGAFTASPGDDWVEIDDGLLSSLSERRHGMIPRVNGSAVDWVSRSSIRPVEIAKQRAVDRIAEAADNAVSKHARPRVVLRLLAAHAVAVGEMIDPQSSASEKAQALARERVIRSQIKEALNRIAECNDRADSLAASVAVAKSVDEIEDIKPTFD